MQTPATATLWTPASVESRAHAFNTHGTPGAATLPCRPAAAPAITASTSLNRSGAWMRSPAGLLWHRQQTTAPAVKGEAARDIGSGCPLRPTPNHLHDPQEHTRTPRPPLPGQSASGGLATTSPLWHWFSSGSRQRLSGRRTYPRCGANTNPRTLPYLWPHLNTRWALQGTPLSTPLAEGGLLLIN